MGKLAFLLIFLGTAATASGEVFVNLYSADGNILPEPQVVMVGTKLSLVVGSSVAEYWSGALTLAGENVNYGVLSGRGYNGFSYEGSCLPAAGDEAVVYDWEESGIDGLDLYTGFSNLEADDWFIIDYIATHIGDCNAGFYAHNIPFDDILIRHIEFTHVRTRDFNNDTQVDFGDFATFASYWHQTGYADPNQCQGTDLDADGGVDANDLILFADYWLEKTDKRWWP